MATISGVHYNMHNIVCGFVEAKDKFYAACCLLPYIGFFGMLWASSKSQFFEAYAAYFIILVGLYLTYVTAIFNLNSTADMKFNWRFYEPILYGAIIYADFNKLLPSDQLVYLYVFFFAQTLLKYILFMTSVITQLTDYLQINFITVGGKGAHNISNNLMGTTKVEDKKHK